MPKAYFFAFILSLSLFGSPCVLQARDAQPTKDADFSLIGAIEQQAARDLYRFANAVNKKIFKVIKTPEEPTKLQKAIDVYTDWFFKFKGSKFRCFLKGISWIPVFPVLLAGIFAVTDTGQEKLKMKDHLSYAGYSLGLLAVQTYLLEKAGINTKQDLTVQTVIDYVKNRIQQEVEKQHAKKSAIEKLQKSRDHTTPEELAAQIQEQSATIALLKERLTKLSEQIEKTQPEQLPLHML